jgi:acyl-coenzyme A thioesterase PaaI-like protein
MISTAPDAISTPPCSQLLGWRVLDARQEKSWICIGFDGRLEFGNPTGLIQGGVLSAMLDDTMCQQCSCRRTADFTRRRAPTELVNTRCKNQEL